MFNYKVTIIIPIYNVEKYIYKCIESVIKQTYDNLEIVLVDDGSSDNCGRICDEFKKKDDRIIVIHKKNAGLSSARNAGLDIMTGDYVYFLDSDDFIEGDTIEYQISLIKKYKADIVACGFYNYDFETKNTIREEVVEDDYISEFNNNEALVKMLDTKVSFGWRAPNKLYKSDLFDKVRFPFGKLYEDVGTTYRIIMNAKRIIYSSVPKYYYVYNPNSITKTFIFNQNECNRIEMAEQMKTEVFLNNNNNYINKKINYFVCTQYVSVVNVMIKSNTYNFQIINRTKKMILFNFINILTNADWLKKMQYLTLMISFRLYKIFFLRFNKKRGRI